MRGRRFAEIVERQAGLGEFGILFVDEAIGAQRRLGVVGRLALVVVGGVVFDELPVPDSGLEAFPIAPVLVREFQQDREIDLSGRKLATEGKIAARHRKFRAHAPPAAFGTRRG